MNEPRNSSETRLQSYEECIGHLKKLEISNSEVAVILSRNDLRIAFPADSPEAEALKRELSNEQTGQKITILKTPNPQHPILIRRLPRRR